MAKKKKMPNKKRVCDIKSVEDIGVEQRLIDKYNKENNDKLKPCYVKLNATSEIKIKCEVIVTEKSNIGNKLPCEITRIDLNTFSIKIKRERDETMDDGAVYLNPSKKTKCQWSSTLRQRINTKKSPKKKSAGKKNICKPSAFTTLKKVPYKSAKLGEPVLCKMRGFCEWPAIVRKIENNSVTVEFFGDHSFTTTTFNNIYNLMESMDLVEFNLKSRRTPSYQKAVSECERVLGIPPEHSIIRN